jgi:exopolysaccharide biosynthesis WecB/TagA/CpsF family protein
MKKQEQSVIEIMENCPNIKLWLGIWSSFDYFVWFQKRAPKIFSDMWLEWLYRIVTWPQKLKRIKRIYNAIIVFLIQVIKTK